MAIMPSHSTRSSPRTSKFLPLHCIVLSSWNYAGMQSPAGISFRNEQAHSDLGASMINLVPCCALHAPCRRFECNKMEMFCHSAGVTELEYIEDPWLSRRSNSKYTTTYFERCQRGEWANGSGPRHRIAMLVSRLRCYSVQTRISKHYTSTSP